MRLLLFTITILVLFLAAAGCMQQQQTITPQTTVTAHETSPGIPEAGSAIVVLNDSQPGASLILDPGVIILSFKTNDSGNLSFFLGTGSKDGYGAGGFISTSAPFFNGSMAIPVPQKDTYLLNISGDGKWTAKVVSLDLAHPLTAPVNLSGFGTMVTPVFSLEKGEYFFERNGTWIVPRYSLQYANGSYLMDANNTYVQPDFGLTEAPFRIVTIPETGIYFLSVMDGGTPVSWSVSITPVPPIPHMGPGPMIPPSTP